MFVKLFWWLRSSEGNNKKVHKNDIYVVVMVIISPKAQVRSMDHISISILLFKTFTHIAKYIAFASLEQLEFHGKFKISKSINKLSSQNAKNSMERTKCLNMS